MNNPLSSNFITSRLQGRTGNMMFQIAHGYAKSLEFNRQFVVPCKESSSDHLENTLFRKLSFDIDRTDDFNQIWCDFEYKDYKPHDDIPTAFCGWFQSEKYFGNYKESIRDLFSPPGGFLNKVYNFYPFFKDSIVAAINVRRGDYLHPDQSSRHPVISLEYINEAYKLLPPHNKLLVMSDDPEWCKENIKLPNVVFSDNTKFWDAEGLWLLSLCSHFIISNSTYSWWGAWLSRNINKTVISPSTWFGPDIKENTNDIYCNNWIKIPTKYSNGKIILA